MFGTKALEGFRILVRVDTADLIELHAVCRALGTSLARFVKKFDDPIKL